MPAALHGEGHSSAELLSSQVCQADSQDWSSQKHRPKEWDDATCVTCQHSKIHTLCLEPLYQSPTVWTSMALQSARSLVDWDAPHFPPVEMYSLFLALCSLVLILLGTSLRQPHSSYWLQLDLINRLQELIATWDLYLLFAGSGDRLLFSKLCPSAPILTGRELFSLNIYCTGPRCSPSSLDDRLNPGQWDAQ